MFFAKNEVCSNLHSGGESDKSTLVEYLVPNTSCTMILRWARERGVLEKSYVVEYSM